MLIVPRTYQVEAVSSVYNYFAEKKGNPVIAMPTGTGKSVVIAMFLESIFRSFPTQKVMVLTHVKELIQQNYDKLIALWPGAPAGINSAGLGQRDVHDRIIFAGIGSVAKWYAQFGHVDLLLIDECHLVSPNEETMYQAFIKGLMSMNPKLKVIGFTATPWRLKQGKITEDGGIFTDICFDITGMEPFNRLIAEGHLCPLIPQNPKALLDVSGVHMRGGEFIAGELQDAVDKDELTYNALREAMEMGYNRKKWLIFAAGVHHALRVSAILGDLGIECPAVHSDLTPAERDKHITALRTGSVRAVVNNNVLTTGLDVPDIDFIVMLRPTASPVLWVQMLGRGTRPFPGKENCLVGDFADNTRRLGPINDPVIPQKKGKKGGKAPVKECEYCATWNHCSVRKCINCGAAFPDLVIKLQTEASSQELIKGDLPIVEICKVDHITYALHQKVGKPDAVKVTYYCGITQLNEYVCLEHEGFAARKARIWWRERTNDPAPRTDDEGGATAKALDRADKLRAPTHLRVWVNKKYPEILAACYDGSAFSAAPAGEAYEPPKVDVQRPRASWGRAGEKYTPDTVNMDDDIPF